MVTRNRLPMDMLEQASRVLRVLAHPHRLKLVELMLDGPVPVGELADAAGLVPAAASQHLNHMRAHGIVDCQREGRLVYYEVINPNAANLIDCLQKHGTGRGR